MDYNLQPKQINQYFDNVNEEEGAVLAFFAGVSSLRLNNAQLFFNSKQLSCFWSSEAFAMPKTKSGHGCSSLQADQIFSA